MAKEVSIYVCDTAVNAGAAKKFLEESGYPSAQISIEAVTVQVIYDAQSNGGGGKTDVAPNGKFVVVGRSG